MYHDYSHVPAIKTRPTEAQVSDYHAAVTALVDAAGSGNARRLEDAFGPADWLVSDDPGIASIPDVRILRATVASYLPENDSRYRSHMSRDELEVCYHYKSSIGQFHPMVARFYDTTYPAMEPTALWPRLGVHLALTQPDDFAGAWALSLVNDSRSYDEAARIIAEPEKGTRPSIVVRAAEMALYLETERWTDLLGACERALAVPLPGSKDSQSHITTRIVHEVAHALTAHAKVILGDNDAAVLIASNLETTGTCDPAVAHGLYAKGMALRAEGKLGEARAALAKAQSTHFTSTFQQAMNDEALTMRVSKGEYIDRRTDKWDVTTEPDPEMMAEKELEEKRRGWRLEGDAMLARKVGMEHIREQLDRYDAQTRGARDRAKRNGTKAVINANMRLTGPPGTGKTTVLKSYARRLAAAGIVREPEPIIITASDLISPNIGATAGKTAEQLLKARGHVLGIDEAYSIVKGSRDSDSNVDAMGLDAIDQIVSMSETLIGELVIVLLGYEDEINRLLETNEGLKGRFPRSIVFNSFTLEQFATVTRLEAENQGLQLSDEAFEFLSDPHGPAGVLLHESNSRGRSLMDALGNGRFARNVAERAQEELDVRNSRFLRDRGFDPGDQDSYNELTNDQATMLLVDDVKSALTTYIDAELSGTSSG